MSLIKEKLGESYSLIESFGRIENNLFFVLDMDDNILDINRRVLFLLGYKNFSEFISSFTNFKELFPGKSAVIDEIKKEKTKIILETSLGKKSYLAKYEKLKVGDLELAFVLLEDHSAFDKARMAHKYFEDFKRKFLTNISHEFRTPMNAIIGFSELLRNTMLNRVQHEYISLVEQSAKSMMNSIENLLDLMQIETNSLAVKHEIFEPIEKFEEFSKTFCQMAKAKNLELFFLIDPHLPKTMDGDLSKIKKILQNLILNAIKFTPNGGQILVKIKVVKVADEIEVNYSITDSGVGISKEKLKTILRPFASSRDNQINGRDGLGVGLSLAHKLLSMMDTKLRVSSEVKRGSKFSFTLKHKQDKVSDFEFVNGAKMLIYSEDKRFNLYNKLIKDYLELFEVEVKNITKLEALESESYDALFILSDEMSKKKLSSIENIFPDIQIIPVVTIGNEKEFKSVENHVISMVRSPLLASDMYETINLIYKKVPKEFLKPSVFDRSENESKAKNILIAEDNPINLKLIQTILMQYNFKITTAQNGKLAVESYQKSKPDLVLMDIDMPIMDGMSATRLIKELDKKAGVKSAPIIALTAHALSGDKEKILKAGLDDHMSKPIDKNLLIDTVHRYLEL